MPNRKLDGICATQDKPRASIEMHFRILYTAISKPLNYQATFLPSTNENWMISYISREFQFRCYLASDLDQSVGNLETLQR